MSFEGQALDLEGTERPRRIPRVNDPGHSYVESVLASSPEPSPSGAGAPPPLARSRDFAEVGPGEGTTARYINADGGGGLVISESDDPTAGYRNILDCTTWVE